jgi:hypothetical protein
MNTILPVLTLVAWSAFWLLCLIAGFSWLMDVL